MFAKQRLHMHACILPFQAVVAATEHVPLCTVGELRLSVMISMFELFFPFSQLLQPSLLDCRQIEQVKAGLILGEGSHSMFG